LYAAVDLDSELSALSSFLLWMNHLISVGWKLPCAANGGEYDLVVQGAKCVECWFWNASLYSICLLHTCKHMLMHWRSRWTPCLSCTMEEKNQVVARHMLMHRKSRWIQCLSCTMGKENQVELLMSTFCT
jgi:hypothetical protein